MTTYDTQISFDIAVLLKDYHLPAEFCYDDENKLLLYSECLNYKCTAPTYGEVFDWLSSKGVIITLEPFFTFSLAGNIGYTWKIDIVNRECAKLETITENDLWTSNKGYGGSFRLQADDAIKEAIKYV